MRASVALLGLALLSSGCDKLKGALSKDDAGSSGATSGGILSFLGTDFEGELTAHVTTKAAPQKASQVIFGIHKPKYRIDVSGAGGAASSQLVSGGSILIDPREKKGWMLVPAQKMAMTLDFEKMKAMKGHVPGVPNAPKGVPAAPTSPPKIDKTGKKDAVAGYACEIWNVTQDGKRAEACVAEGITWIDLSDLGLGSPEMSIAAIASEANRFPLRVISFDAKGAEETRMEVTKVDKKKLDDARFVVPPDYRVVDMAQMMGGGVGTLPTMPAIPAPPKR